MIKTKAPDTTEIHYDLKAQQYIKRKYIVQKYILGLANLRSALEKKYWKTYHCASELTKETSLAQDGTQINTRYYTQHCKLSHCVLCSQKRATVLIHQYKCTLDSWTDKQFLTLTVPSVQAPDLRESLKLMRSELGKAVRNINQKRKKVNLEPIRLAAHFETTYSADFADYHPHLHAVVYNEIDAQELRAEWIKRFPAVNPFLQHIRKADENSTREIFKYFTKIISPDKSIYLQALDTIFQASTGMRKFVVYGVKADPKSKNDYKDFIAKLEQETTETILSTFEYIHDFKTYVDTTTGEVLSEYEVSESLENIKVESHNPKPRYNNPIRHAHKLQTKRKRKKDTLPGFKPKTRQKALKRVTDGIKLLPFFNEFPVPSLE